MVVRAVVKGAVFVAVVTLFCSMTLFAGDEEAGKAVYLKKCKTCHGAEGQGNPGMAKVLKVEIKHLGSEAVQSKSDEELKAVITEGAGKMKPVKGVSATDVDKILAFLRTIEE